MQQPPVPELQLSTKLQLQLLSVPKLQASSVPVLQQSPVFEPIAAVPSPCSCGAAAVTNSSAAATYWAWVTVLSVLLEQNLSALPFDPAPWSALRPNLSIGLALGLWLWLRPYLSLSALLNNEINVPLSQRIWSTGAVGKGTGTKCVPTTAYLWKERDVHLCLSYHSWLINSTLYTGHLLCICV